MNKKIAIIVAVVVVLIIGAILWLKNNSLAPSPTFLNEDRGAPFGTPSQTVNSTGNTSPGNTPSGTEPSTSGATPSTSAPKGTSPTTSGTSQPAGSDQTAAKKEATKLINQSSVTANEFNTMNNSAGQIDPNTSL